MKYIDSQSLSRSLLGAYKRYPTKDTMFAVLSMLIYWMNYLENEVSNSDLSPEDKGMWLDLFHKFDERLIEYEAAIDGASSLEDLSRYVVDPLFFAIYPVDMNLEDPPTWPDIETPWRLTNDLISFSNKSISNSEKELLVSLDIGKASLEESKNNADDSDKGLLEDAQEYLENIKKNIEDYIAKEKTKEIAQKAKPWLLAGLGAIAALAIVKARKQQDGA